MCTETRDQNDLDVKAVAPAQLPWVVISDNGYKAAWCVSRAWQRGTAALLPYMLKGPQCCLAGHILDGSSMMREFLMSKAVQLLDAVTVYCIAQSNKIIQTPTLTRNQQ